MSSSPANCDLMRSHRVIPLLVQLLHGPPQVEAAAAAECDSLKQPREVRLRVAKSLHNMVHAHPTDKQCKREAKVLRLLETLRMYSDLLADVAAAAEDVRMELANSDEEKECDEHESVASLHRCLANCLPVKVRVAKSPNEDAKDILLCGK